MNSLILKSLLDQQQRQAQQNRYNTAFNNFANAYENSVKQAYGLEDPYEFMREGPVNRLADIITSRTLSSLGNPRVSEGRAGLRNIEPQLTALIREKGIKDAFQGAAEAKMQLPDADDVAAMLKWIKTNRESLNIPSEQTPVAPKADANEYRSIMEKYGY